jgi:hypothetical protein
MNKMRGHELGWLIARQGELTGSFEQGVELQGSIKGGRFVELLTMFLSYC